MILGFSMDVLISTTTPDMFFRFLETVESLQRSTINQIRSCMKDAWGPVRATKAFCAHYGFIEEKKEMISLTNQGIRLLKHTDNARRDFLIFTIKLQEKEPFLFLKNELQKNDTFKKNRIGELLQIKFRPKENWIEKKVLRFSDVYLQWLTVFRQAKIEEKNVKYIGGKTKTFEILIIPEMRKLLDRHVYDYLIENFYTPHNILDEPNNLLHTVETTSDDREKGKKFEKFVASCFQRLGFDSRCRDGIREKRVNLTYQRKGGGDTAVFCHFPTPAIDKTHQGYAIACEAKSASYPIGSKAVGQARNFSKKIKEAFPDYLVHTMVVSRSKTGFDSSGKEQATPEVVHINCEIMLELLNAQKDRLKNGLLLITPLEFMTILSEFVREKNLEPKKVDVVNKINSLLQ